MFRLAADGILKSNLVCPLCAASEHWFGDNVMLPRLLLWLGIAAVALLSTSSASFAEFQVCNRTSADEINVAIGLYQARKGWESEGWYTVARNECTTLVEQMADRYYYLYVESGDTTWDGSDDEAGSNFCVHPENAFNLNVAEFADRGSDNPNCEKHGHQTKRFFRVDTENSSDYTFDINN